MLHMVPYSLGLAPVSQRAQSSSVDIGPRYSVLQGLVSSRIHLDYFCDMVHYISTRKDWIVKPLIIPILASLKELENLKNMK